MAADLSWSHRPDAISGMQTVLIWSFWTHMQILFVPPTGLWDSMNKTASRVAASDQKEQFDRMEKSTSDLLEVIRAAKEEAFGK